MVKSRVEFAKKFPGHYAWLLRYNRDLIDRAFPLTKKTISLTDCKKDALKYKTRSEWAKKSPSSYSKARRYGKLDEYCKHMEHGKTPNGFWSLEKCKKESQKYKTRSEWQSKDSRSYAAARNRGWLVECCKHMEKKLIYWSLELCKRDALKYKTKEEWKKGSPKSYESARHNDWISKCCEHMPKNAHLRMVVNLDTMEVFNSAAEVAKSLGIPSFKSNLCRAIKNNTKAGGYRWAYCDEDGNVIKQTKGEINARQNKR